MRAAVIEGIGRLEVVDLPDPVCPEGGALIEVEACSVCGTDVKMLRSGHKDLTYPRVPGHEIVGRVRELDRPCGDISEGDLVQVWPGIACGSCRPCQRGQDSLCHEMRILGFSLDGGFAELISLPGEGIERGLNRVCGRADPAVLALSEPLACCMNGQDLSRVSVGDSVLVIGAGPAGCLHSLLARHRGAERIVLAEIAEPRIELAKRLGADRIVDPSSEPLAKAVAEETDGLGIDVILAATPEVRIDSAIMDMLAPGGRVCIFSGPKAGHGLEAFDLRSMHYRETMMVGAYGCTSRHYRKAARMIESGQIDLAELITMRAPLERVDDAFEHARRRLGLKAVIDSF